MRNDMIKSRFIDSMIPKLANQYIVLPTAEDVWGAVLATYYDSSDKIKFFELIKSSILIGKSELIFPLDLLQCTCHYDSGIKLTTRLHR
jgi:hypothetical protein